MMSDFLLPVPDAKPYAQTHTFIDLEDRSVIVPPQSEGKLIRWLEANGVDAKVVLVDQTISAKGGRIRCTAVDLDEYGVIRFTDPDRAISATKEIDVPMTREPHEFGLSDQPNHSKRPQETMTQTPSVGRVVHYHSYGTPGGEYLPEPRAAIITEVTGPEGDWVSLAVLNPTGMFFKENLPFSEEPKPGHWSWPPRVLI